MTDAARENFVLIALLSVLVFAGGAALFAVGLMLLHREEEPAPKPHRARPHVAHVVPREPDPAIVLPPLAVEVEYRVGQVKPDTGDPTAVVHPTPTRFDLMKEHVERGAKWRQP